MKEWHCVLFGQVQGPFPEARMKEMADAGEIERNTLVWSGSTPEDASRGWTQADETELKALFSTPPPLPQTGLRSSVEKPSAEEKDKKDALGEDALDLEAQTAPLELTPKQDAPPAKEADGSMDMSKISSRFDELSHEARGQHDEQAPPQSQEFLTESTGTFELATRRRRFSAGLLEVFVGALMGFLVGAFVAFLMIFFTNASRALTTHVAESMATLVYCSFSLYFLHRDGQTISKKILGIKIVNTDGSRTPLWKIIVLRNGIYIVLSVGTNVISKQIPFIGGIFALATLLFCIVDSLFIFRKDRRTLHDLIAGTIVVKKRS